MSNRTIIITGCGGLLGIEFIKVLLSKGHTVLGTEISDSKIHKISEMIQDENFSCFKCDVSSEKDVVSFFKHLSTLKNSPDTLINNASITSEYLKENDLEPLSFIETSYQSWQKCMDTNLGGVFLMSKEFVKLSQELAPNKAKKIINISSIYALHGPNPKLYEDTGIKSFAAYSASKAGVIGLTKWMAGFLASHNFTCNTVAPGGVFNNHSKIFELALSSMIPLERMANPNDISGTVSFLCSEESNYINGQVLYVDGGYSSR